MLSESRWARALCCAVTANKPTPLACRAVTTPVASSSTPPGGGEISDPTMKLRLANRSAKLPPGWPRGTSCLAVPVLAPPESRPGRVSRDGGATGRAAVLANPQTNDEPIPACLGVVPQQPPTPDTPAS